MRRDGLPERFTEQQTHRIVEAYMARGNNRLIPIQRRCDLSELSRLIHVCFTLYQSSHITKEIEYGVVFPYAWHLESGDKVYNSSKDEYYTIKDPEKIYDLPDYPYKGKFPDVQEMLPPDVRLKKAGSKGKYPKYLPPTIRLGIPASPSGTGEVGYIVTLIDANGNKVRPSEQDILLFESDRYVKLTQINRNYFDADYAGDPEDDEFKSIIKKTKFPQLLYYTRRIEPASRDTQKFGAKKEERPRASGATVRDPNDPNVEYQVYSLILELINRYYVLAETQEEALEFNIYVMRFFERYADIFRLNGVLGVAYWQTLVLAGNNKTDIIGYSLDYYFRVENIDTRMRTLRKDVRFSEQRVTTDGESAVGDITLS